MPSRRLYRVVLTCIAAGQMVACSKKPDASSPTIHAVPPAAAEPAFAVQCQRQITLPAEASGRVLVLGDLHGTNEIPALVGDVACSLLATGATVRVGLEMMSSEQERIDAFLASDGSPEARAALIAGDFWSYYDGRSSVAMFRLLDRIRSLARGGAKISIFAFDVSDARTMENRDEIMAKNIAADIAAHPHASHLVYVGNLHARTAKGSPWDPEYRPMGTFLVARGVEVLSLDVAAPSGEAWYRGAPTDPGSAKPTGSAYPEEMRRGSSPSSPIKLFATRSPQGYDGVYAIAAPTASPPMRLAEGSATLE